MSGMDEFESWDKIDEIRLILDELNIKYETHFYDDEEFDYLNDNEICVKIPNPYSDRTMFIDLQDEISLFFGPEWHEHYYLTEEYFEKFRDVFTGILKNEYCSAAVFIGEDLRWHGSMIADRKSVAEKSAEKIFAECFQDSAKTFRRSWEEKGAEIHFRFWNPIDDKMVVIERKNKL